MKISVELTLSPLQDDYEPAIIDMIRNLRNSGLKVIETPLSTQVYGEYSEVMEILNREIEKAFDAMERGLVYMKIVKSDRSNYEPHF
ncbi:MAG TPA: thiamine-binding protein [Flavobacteriaceae bacterium]|nr:thiamine-binding protein [Flavobacteriaceae bacterium]